MAFPTAAGMVRIALEWSLLALKTDAPKASRAIKPVVEILR